MFQHLSAALFVLHPLASLAVLSANVAHVLSVFLFLHISKKYSGARSRTAALIQTKFSKKKPICIIAHTGFLQILDDKGIPTGKIFPQHNIKGPYSTQKFSSLGSNTTQHNTTQREKQGRTTAMLHAVLLSLLVADAVAMSTVHMMWSNKVILGPFRHPSRQQIYPGYVRTVGTSRYLMLMRLSFKQKHRNSKWMGIFRHSFRTHCEAFFFFF